MHGPTFMANPLACAVAAKSTELLISQDWQSNIQRIETQLHTALTPLQSLEYVHEVRVLGAIGVVDAKFRGEQGDGLPVQRRGDHRVRRLQLREHPE